MPRIERDPLSVHYDAAARRLLMQAAAAHKDRRAVRTWVQSPPAEFRLLDAGGRTAHERAFTRACYYLVTCVSLRWDPRRQVMVRYWSLDLDWGRIENHGGRWGRVVRARLYRYGSGYRKAARGDPGRSWQRSGANSYVGPDGVRVMPEWWMRQQRSG